MVDVEEARDKIAYGRERKKGMDEEDRRSTAYHEAGHAVVQALIDDGALPLHKVTIIPRGRALGMAMLMPTKDLLGYSKQRLLNYICMAMAGRIGERVTTGDVSNGASSDIKQATRMARQMVCDWGMSDLGPIAFGENSDTVFLGREISRTQSHGDETARRIDEAVARHRQRAVRPRREAHRRATPRPIARSPRPSSSTRRWTGSMSWRSSRPAPSRRPVVGQPAPSAAPAPRRRPAGDPDDGRRNGSRSRRPSPA